MQKRPCKSLAAAADVALQSLSCERLCRRVRPPAGQASRNADHSAQGRLRGLRARGGDCLQRAPSARRQRTVFAERMTSPGGISAGAQSSGTYCTPPRRCSNDGAARKGRLVVDDAGRRGRCCTRYSLPSAFMLVASPPAAPAARCRRERCACRRVAMCALSTAEQRFVEWCGAAGASLPALEMAYFPLPGGHSYRGLRATRDVPADVPFLSVPLAHCLHSHAPRTGPSPAPRPRHASQRACCRRRRSRDARCSLGWTCCRAT